MKEQSFPCLTIKQINKKKRQHEPNHELGARKRVFFSLLRAGGDVSESHNGCRSRSWRLRRHIKTSVRQRQRQRRVSTKGFVIIIISHINSPRLINDLRRGCLKTKRVHAAAAAAGNDGLVWFVIYYFVEALRKTVTRGERERETENRGSYLLPPPSPGQMRLCRFSAPNTHQILLSGPSEPRIYGLRPAPAPRALAGVQRRSNKKSHFLKMSQQPS